MTRVVSLVPSVTETLLALGVVPVACTRFCEQPHLRAVGGTKDPHVEEIAELAPDLVVVNDEENRLEDVERLRALGLRLHDMSPRSVAEVGPAVARLADAVGAPVPAPFAAGDWEAWLARWHARREDVLPGRRAFVAVWRRPWMSLSADTFGSSMLDLLGWDNVLAGHAERYPTVDDLAGVAALRPDAVLLPTEPYPFKERHLAEVEEWVPGAAAALVDGQDLFWWGIRTPGAADRLAAVLDRIAGGA